MTHREILQILRTALTAEIEANAPYAGDFIFDQLTKRLKRYLGWTNEGLKNDELAAVYAKLMGPNDDGPFIARLIRECAQQRALAGAAQPAFAEAAE